MDALVTPAELFARLDDPVLRVVEVKLAADGGAGAFAAGHVPGAAFSDYAADGWRAKRGNAPGMLPDEAHLSALLGRLGITPAHHVVLVPSGTSANDLAASARVYFTLKYAGHAGISILDGGIAAWLADPALPVEQGGSKVAPAPDYPLRLVSALRAQAADVLDVVKGGGASLLDARAPSYFEGIEKASEARVAGRIPGAINRDYALLFDASHHGLRPKATLASLFEDIPAGPVISYCNTGHTAALDWFVLSQVLGRADVRLYDGSMTDWTQDEARPVASN